MAGKAKKSYFLRQYKRKPVHELKSSAKIRNRIFEQRGRVCERCGWSCKNTYHNIVPVQINHKDGNRDNNLDENLEILCPNCHSLTEHFMFFGKSHKDNYGQKGTKRYR